MAVDTLRAALWFIPNLLHAVVDKALRTLYFDGPRWWGMWGVQEPAAICQALTGVTALHWTSTDEARHQCEVEIESHYRQFYIGVMTVVVVLCLYKCIQILLTYCFFVRPIMQTLQGLSPFRKRHIASSGAMRLVQDSIGKSP